MAAVTLFGFAVAVSAQSYNSNSANYYNGNWNNNATSTQANANLTGSQEVPLVSASTTGSGGVWFEQNGSGMSSWLSVWNGTDVTAAHLHCGDLGENGPAVVTLFENSNGVDVNGSLVSKAITNGDIADVNCTSVIGYDINTVSELAQAIRNGDIYMNVHDKEHPNGVVRGQLVAQNQSGGNHEGKRTDGYWDKDKKWHKGMEGKSDNGYWGDDNCWNENGSRNGSDGKGGHNDWNDSDRKHDSDKKGWDNDRKNQWKKNDSKHQSNNNWSDGKDRKDGTDGKSGRDGTDGKDGDDGRDGKDGNDYSQNDNRRDYKSWRSSGSSSSVSSVINAVNSVRVRVD